MVVLGVVVDSIAAELAESLEYGLSEACLLGVGPTRQVVPVVGELLLSPAT